VSYREPDLQMPPKRKLSENQVADLAQWIRSGAVWPPSDRAELEPRALGTATGRGADHWSFQPVRRPEAPRAAPYQRQLNPIDAFISAKLADRSLAPNGPATRRELIRRVYFDLIGLPPSYESVTAFERDPAPDAYARLIEQLLALPQYGERWGRHWLDVVRFAQTTGYERDGEKPLSWRYRDYVIQSFNEDKPYDLFVREQLAGDELDPPTPSGIIATGFFRLGVWDDEPADKEAALFDEFDDYISTTGAAFLGLTLGCARCHDHKFDPIPQSDYYSLLAFFRNVRAYQSAKPSLDSPAYVPLAHATEVQRWKREQAHKLETVDAALTPLKQENQKSKSRIKELETELAALASPSAVSGASGGAGSRVEQESVLALRKSIEEEKQAVKSREPAFAKLEQERSGIAAASPNWEWALAARESGAERKPTHVLVRGNALTRGREVQPAFLTVLGGGGPDTAQSRPDASSTGLRLALANWLTRPDHPLTARVMVNRIWKHHFGQGLVKTTTDFGRIGAPPTHPELLDWLASEFVRGGWSVKRMHRLILLSEAYQRSSRSDDESALRLDPGNDLVWRQSLRRLEAEAVRDTILQVSSALNYEQGGRGFFPRLAGEVLAGASRPGLDWEIQPPSTEARRSVYAFIKRTLAVPVLQNLDYSTTDSPLGERPTTTVAPQALLLLNDAFMLEQADKFARRLASEAGSDSKNQIRRGYQVALAREPSDRELEVAAEFLQRQTDGFEARKNRLLFRPDVPESLFREYQQKLAAERYLVGPRHGWSYNRGDWTADYEGIRSVDRLRGPFALWTGATFSNAVIEARLTLSRASEFASILLRAKATNELQSGYEVALDARQQKVIVRQHGSTTKVVAEAAAGIRTGHEHRVRIDINGTALRVWLDAGAEPVLRAELESAPGEGYAGVRAWGAAVALDQLSIEAPGGRQWDIAATTARSEGKSSRDRALESLCLMLLNLNELVYVD
jgi:cytochrome c553/cell division septum initiation protein DivIVA